MTLLEFGIILFVSFSDIYRIITYMSILAGSNLWSHLLMYNDCQLGGMYAAICCRDGLQPQFSVIMVYSNDFSPRGGIRSTSLRLARPTQNAQVQVRNYREPLRTVYAGPQMSYTGWERGNIYWEISIFSL